MNEHEAPELLRAATNRIEQNIKDLCAEIDHLRAELDRVEEENDHLRARLEERGDE